MEIQSGAGVHLLPSFLPPFKLLARASKKEEAAKGGLKSFPAGHHPASLASWTLTA